MHAYLSSKLGGKINRFLHLGWVNTKLWCQNLDLYYDSSPRGSCNTIFETIESSIPVLMINSSHNRESSALPYLSSAFDLGDEKNLNTLGIFK